MHRIPRTQRGVVTWWLVDVVFLPSAEGNIEERLLFSFVTKDEKLPNDVDRCDEVDERLTSSSSPIAQDEKEPLPMVPDDRRLIVILCDLCINTISSQEQFLLRNESTINPRSMWDTSLESYGSEVFVLFILMVRITNRRCPTAKKNLGDKVWRIQKRTRRAILIDQPALYVLRGHCKTSSSYIPKRLRLSSATKRSRVLSLKNTSSFLGPQDENHQEKQWMLGAESLWTFL